MTNESMPTDLTDVADEAMEVLLPVAEKGDVKLVLDAPTRVIISTSCRDDARRRIAATAARLPGGLPGGTA